MIKKYYFPLLLICSLSFFITPCSLAQSGILQEGSDAPLFTAQASLDGKEFEFSLKEALDRGPVVVYFYPSAFTGGCDLEAHTFSTMKDEFEAAGTTIIGISADDMERLNAFSSDSEYCAGKFPVASDPEGKIAASYGLEINSPREGAKDVRGIAIKHGFIPRTTFVINDDGKIAAVFSTRTDHISPDEHVKKALTIVEDL